MWYYFILLLLSIQYIIILLLLEILHSPRIQPDNRKAGPFENPLSTLIHRFQIENHTRNVIRRVWVQRIETEGETVVLGPSDNFGE
jgi:hypothetical protein